METNSRLLLSFKWKQIYKLSISEKANHNIPLTAILQMIQEDKLFNKNKYFT